MNAPNAFPFRVSGLLVALLESGEQLLLRNAREVVFALVVVDHVGDEAHPDVRIEAQWWGSRQLDGGWAEWIHPKARPCELRGFLSFAGRGMEKSPGYAPPGSAPP